MNGVSGEGKRRRMRLPVEQQLEIIACFENGEKPARIARAKGLSDSSVRAIIRRKEELKKWLEINQTLGASKESSQFKTRSSAMETMERLLVTWIENCNQQNIRLDTPTIQAKAKDFFTKIKNEQEFCDMTQTELKESFDASKGWFYRFKKRTGVQIQRLLDEQSGSISKKTFAPT